MDWKIKKKVQMSEAVSSSQLQLNAGQKTKEECIRNVGDLQRNPIPERPDPVRFEKHNFISSRFKEIRSNDIFDVQMQYPLLGMEHAETKCLVREEVYDRLLFAAKELPEGCRFVIYDAWRPFELQKELFQKYSLAIIQEFALENSSEEEKKAGILKFVSEPVADRFLPPVHTTGGAIDLTIRDAQGQIIPMGTGFDAFTDKTHTTYFEQHKQQENAEEIRNNRRLLYSVMTNAGFTNLPSEWWHFDYGDRFWAYYTGQPAMYSGVFTKDEITVIC